MVESDFQTGSRAEFKTYQHISDKHGRVHVKTILEPFGKDIVGRDKDGSYALVIERHFEAEKSNPKLVSLRVNSPQLLKAFRQVIKSYTTVASDFATPFELNSPFQMLVHYWDELHGYFEEAEDPTMRQHLKMLFAFMDHELEPERNGIMEMITAGQISYYKAWVLYRPGDLLYAQVLGQPWLLRCVKTVYEESASRGPYFEVHCTYTDSDGETTGQASYHFTMFQKKLFGSENPAQILNLPIYPRKYHKETAILEEKLQVRGKRFFGYRKMSVQAYNGLAQYLKEPQWSIYDPTMADWEAVWLPYTETGRVVLDTKLFHEEQYSYGVRIQKSEPDLLLCPPFTIGYSLNRKDWCRFLIDNIHDVHWNKYSWDSLILSEEKKLALRALVSSHRYPANPRDRTQLKGKGLVILLHGTPGSGKTLSAETSAEATERALLSSSIGELNRENLPFIFEIRLKQILQYASLWKAIVLLDEADVFLEARDEKSGNPTRNALVAVFLKELEYFSGIVFLTTNRVDIFDAAMRSRVHLALEFHPPEILIRRQIWIQCLRKLAVEESAYDEQSMEEDVTKLGHEKLNGREISNVVNTAWTMARFEGRSLTMADIQTIIKIRRDFDASLEVQKRKLTRADSAGHFGSVVRRNSMITEEPEEYVS